MSYTPRQTLTDTSHQPQQTQRHQITPRMRLRRLVDKTLLLTDILGTGANGVVYRAVSTDTGGHCAVKWLRKYNPDGTPLSRQQMDCRQREISLHHMASAHPNIVSLIKVVDDYDGTYVVMEYCPGGDLFYNICTLGRFVGEDILCKNVFVQILDAVEHCHNLGIYHRDLKPENILVTDYSTVKIADFGLATSTVVSNDFGCGSTSYMSPECMSPCSRKPYYVCASNDVWSLGVILVNLTCGRNPWQRASDKDCAYRAFTRSQTLQNILPLTDELNDILKQIFHPNPELRITISELRRQILACGNFTVSSTVEMTMLTPPSTPPTNSSHEQDVMSDGNDMKPRYSASDTALVNECYPSTTVGQCCEPSAPKYTDVRKLPACTRLNRQDPPQTCRQLRSRQPRASGRTIKYHMQKRARLQFSGRQKGKGVRLVGQE